MSPQSTLVLGLGNTLLQDEALGVRAVEALHARLGALEGVELLDGGTLGLDLLPYLSEARSVMILDAVHFDAEPGTLIRLEGDAIPAALKVKMSMHQVGLNDLLAATAFRGKTPERLVLWGMQPGGLDWGLDLTAPVAERLDALVDRAEAELRMWLSDSASASTEG